VLVPIIYHGPSHIPFLLILLLNDVMGLAYVGCFGVIPSHSNPRIVPNHHIALGAGPGGRLAHVLARADALIPTPQGQEQLCELAYSILQVLNDLL